jgi:subtilisin family serine protease
MRKLTTSFLAGILVAMCVLFANDSVSHAQKQSGEKEAERAKVASYIEKGDTTGAEKLMQELKAKSPENNHSVQPFNFHVLFEEAKACGFYPQETRLECMIEIKQVGGYAGPIGSPGSTEYVYFCVDLRGSGLEPVGMGNLQMHDESNGAQPTWQYAVYRDFNPLGGVRTSNTGNATTTVTSGPTRKARAILSWVLTPTDCNYIPYWGNVKDFRIRFDPIR